MTARTPTALIPAVVLALTAAAIARGDEPKPNERWTPEAMLRVKQVGGVQVSPDGERVAYVVRRAVMEGERSEFVSQVHVAKVDGTDDYPLTAGEDSSEGPQWSPDGETIAFLRKRSGKPQVWLIRVRGGEPRPLTDAKGGVVGFRWSPDGKRIAYAATDPVPGDWATKVKAKDDARVVDDRVERNRLCVIDVEGSGGPREGRTLTRGELSVFGDSSPGFDWSPDGKAIVFAHVPTPSADDWTRSDISVVEIETGSVKPLAQSRRSESSPFFSPDGRQVAFTASDDPPSWSFDSAVFVVPAAGGTPRKLADTFDHRPELLGWSAEGTQLLVRENRGTTTRLYALPLEGPPQGVGPDDGVVAEASLNPSRTAVGFSYQAADGPAEAFVCRLDRPSTVKVSRVNSETPDRPIGRTEVIRWKSSDGTEVEGLLTLPPGFEEGRKYPLLLVIHGGPAGVFTRTFIASPVVSTSGGRHSTSTYPVAAFASLGYAVLRCNVRGSSGYGRAFRSANVNDWGGGDYNDLMAGVDHVIARGVADPDRLGVMGWSYGGFMTSWVIGHTSRFKAASVGAGVTDLVSFTGTADIPSFLPSYFGGEAWHRAEVYREHSPIAHVKGVGTPTLIQHGEDDERVPIAQGYELYNALKRQGCPVKMVVYPRAHHAIQEPKLLLDAMKRNLDWFETRVGEADSKASSATETQGPTRLHAALKPVGQEAPPAPRQVARKPRARDLGVPFEGSPGPLNAITDVAGVAVGHATLISGDGKLEVGKGPVRTGVTAILPRGKNSLDPVFAGYFSLNGNGEMTGTAWVEESGLLDGPVMVTNTHSVGVVRDAVIAYRVKRGDPDPEGYWWSLPVVAETWDGELNDINGFHVKPGHVFSAIEGADSGPVAEGNVGGGTGMICYEFKGGVGSSSRRLGARDGGYTVGVLVQANHGLRGQLQVAGVPVGREIPERAFRAKESGSIIIVVATDAPLLPHQLKRLARRVSLGLARAGSISGNGSGDFFLAFSTANVEAMKPAKVATVKALATEEIDPIFEATVQATEEAVINALVAAETMTGINGHRVDALPHDRLAQALRKYNRLVEKEQ